MELHETLAQLRRDHGEATFRDADAFRGALDDYLDEGSASMGTINLLTDAVRLGAVESMVSMLDSGATAESAVDSAGRRLSRDRGSADIVGSQWACAVLGYALGRVPASMVSQLRPDAITAEPPRNEGGTAARPQTPPPHMSPPTSVAPSGQPAPPGPPAAPPHVSPPTHAPGPAYGSSYPTPPAGYGPPQPPKSKTGLIIGLVVAAVLVLVLGTVGVIALTGGDDGDDTDAGDDTTSDVTSGTTSDGSTSEAPTTDTTTDGPTSETAGALTITGSGYTYQLPSDEWTDVTADLADQSPTIDTVSAWGRAIETARANLLVETSSAFGAAEPSEVKDSWIDVVSGSTGATPEEIDPITIAGQETVGIELNWTNQHGIDIRQIAYLAIWDGQQYSITMTITQDDDEIEATFYDILDTWAWV